MKSISGKESVIICLYDMILYDNLGLKFVGDITIVCRCAIKVNKMFFLGVLISKLEADMNIMFADKNKEIKIMALARSLREILFSTDLERKSIVIYDEAGRSLCKALLSSSEYKLLVEEGISLESSSVNHKLNYTGKKAR